jgi:hypothetical protein
MQMPGGCRRVLGRFAVIQLSTAACSCYMLLGNSVHMIVTIVVTTADCAVLRWSAALHCDSSSCTAVRMLYCRLVSVVLLMSSTGLCNDMTRNCKDWVPSGPDIAVRARSSAMFHLLGGVLQLVLLLTLRCPCVVSLSSLPRTDSYW